MSEVAKVVPSNGDLAFCKTILALLEKCPMVNGERKIHVTSYQEFLAFFLKYNIASLVSLSEGSRYLAYR